MNTLLLHGMRIAIAMTLSFLVLFGHEVLTDGLAVQLRLLEVAAPERAATVFSSLLVHLLSSAWILPQLIRRRPCAIGVEALRLAAYVSFALMFVRVAAEAGLGFDLRGLPWACAPVGVLAIALARDTGSLARSARTRRLVQPQILSMCTGTRRRAS